MWVWGVLLCLCVCVWVGVHTCTHSAVSDSATLWTVALQTLPMELFRQVHWSGLPFPTPGDLPNPGTEPVSPVSCTGRRILYQLCHLGSQMRIYSFHSQKKDYIRSVFFMLTFYAYYYVLDTLHILRHLILFNTLKYLQATFTTTLIIKYVSLRDRLTPVCHSMVRGKDKCCFPIISIKIFNSRLNYFQFLIN